MTVGFIGLGKLGWTIARRVLRGDDDLVGPV